MSRWRLWLIVGLLVAVCSACSSPTMVERTPVKLPAPVDEALVTLTYWEEESDDGDVLLDSLTAEFVRAQRHVKVERVHLSYEELLDRLSRGGARPGALHQRVCRANE